MTTRHIGGREFDFERQVAVMAVVNRTPDSFYDKGSTFALDSAIAAAVRAAELGADWVDIGGVPFGRGPAVTLQEELDRVVPVVAGIAERSDVVVSVDTTSAEVARASIAAGASVINDTSGLHDPRMLEVVASSSAQLVITHSVGAPAASRRDPSTTTSWRPWSTICGAASIARSGGVPAGRIIVDPGHDLNKNTLHTLELTRRLGEVAALGFPVLAAVSNKDFIGEALDRPQGSASRAPRRRGDLHPERCADRTHARRAPGGGRRADDGGGAGLAGARLPPPQRGAGGVSARIDGLSPAGQDLSDEALLALYADGAGEEWLRVNFVASVDGAVTRDGVSGDLGARRTCACSTCSAGSPTSCSSRPARCGPRATARWC